MSHEVNYRDSRGTKEVARRKCKILPLKEFINFNFNNLPNIKNTLFHCAGTKFPWPGTFRAEDDLSHSKPLSRPDLPPDP
jgi:hypothetical protein